MAPTKKTPAELAAAKLAREQQKENDRLQQLADRQKAEAEFIQDRPLAALELLKQASELRDLADEAGIPDHGDFSWGDTDTIAIVNLCVHYVIWGDDTIIEFIKLLEYSKKDYNRFNDDFTSLREHFTEKLQAKRDAELEEERVRKIKVEALSKLSDEEKKVLGIK